MTDYHAKSTYSQPGQLLTVPEAADRLRVSPRTIYRMIQEGELKRVKIRDATRIKETDITNLEEYQDEDYYRNEVEDLTHS